MYVQSMSQSINEPINHRWYDPCLILLDFLTLLDVLIRLDFLRLLDFRLLFSKLRELLVGLMLLDLWRLDLR
jgi:hypothetical protein